MATTYLAPGVYVEEVPSAQQPIAGVGTNTVGFIGIVPDRVDFPEPNEHYDEYLAQTLTDGRGTTPKQQEAYDAARKHLDAMVKLAADAEDIKAANARAGELQKQLDDAKKRLTARENEVTKALEPKPEAGKAGEPGTAAAKP